MKQRQRTAEEQRDVARMMLDKADEIQAFELRASLDTAVRDMVATATMKLVEQACLMAADADFMEGLIDVEEIYSTAAWNAAAILDPDFNLRWMDQNLRKHLGIGWPSNWSPWERFPKRRAA